MERSIGRGWGAGFGAELLTSAAELAIDSGIKRQGRGRFALHVRHAQFSDGLLGAHTHVGSPVVGSSGGSHVRVPVRTGRSSGAPWASVAEVPSPRQAQNCGPPT